MFSMAEVDATSLDQADVEEGEKIEAAKSDDWRLRLYSKTRPVQIGLLREHGLSRAAAAAWPSQSCTAPMCLCGGELERLDVRTRILRMLEAADSAWRSRVPESQVEPMIAHLARSPLVTCDLCSKVATITGVVWSCGNVRTPCCTPLLMTFANAVLQNILVQAFKENAHQTAIAAAAAATVFGGAPAMTVSRSHAAIQRCMSWHRLRIGCGGLGSRLSCLGSARFRCPDWSHHKFYPTTSNTVDSTNTWIYLAPCCRGDHPHFLRRAAVLPC